MSCGVGGGSAIVSPMCNLYSVTKGQAAIIELTKAMRDTTGNLPPQPSIFGFHGTGGAHG